MISIEKSNYKVKKSKLKESLFILYIQLLITLTKNALR